ncbi:MAG: hypothetical protein JWM16_6319 [Verrucomicrobiales bacterium]|nr:hypothetical protein [Verrucomicrobiales bacterium]
MAMIAYEANVKAQPPRSAPAFTDPVSDANEQMTTLLTRIEKLADTLCGSTPTGEDANGLRQVSNGVFDQVAEQGRSIISKATAAIECINRIERSLP